jgi:hypothetical protein
LGSQLGTVAGHRIAFAFVIGEVEFIFAIKYAGGERDAARGEVVVQVLLAGGAFCDADHLAFEIFKFRDPVFDTYHEGLTVVKGRGSKRQTADVSTQCPGGIAEQDVDPSLAHGVEAVVWSWSGNEGDELYFCGIPEDRGSDSAAEIDIEAAPCLAHAIVEAEAQAGRR